MNFQANLLIQDRRIIITIVIVKTNWILISFHHKHLEYFHNQRQALRDFVVPVYSNLPASATRYDLFTIKECLLGIDHCKAYSLFQLSCIILKDSYFQVACYLREDIMTIFLKTLGSTIQYWTWGLADILLMIKIYCPSHFLLRVESLVC